MMNMHVFFSVISENSKQ